MVRVRKEQMEKDIESRLVFTRNVQRSTDAEMIPTGAGAKTANPQWWQNQR